MAGGGIKQVYNTIRGGADGATFTPRLEDGKLKWSNNKGYRNPPDMDVIGPKGDKGDKGDRGIQGERGFQGEKGEKGDVGGTAPVVQATGYSETVVMSQKAVTDELGVLKNRVTDELGVLKNRVKYIEGATLSTIIDDTAAYKKSVPVGVAPYAAIEKIGGMTYRKVLDEGNLYPYPYKLEWSGSTVDKDGVWRCENPYKETDTFDIATDTITLPEGNYICDVGNDFGIAFIDVRYSGKEVSIESIEGTSTKVRIVANDSWTFSGVNVYIYELAYVACYPMLYLEDKPITWQPRGKAELHHAKVTAIESKGANEFTDSARIFSNYQYISAYMVFTFDGLIPNSPYTISLVNGYKGNAESHTEKYVNLSNKSFEPINSGALGWLVHPSETYCSDLQTVTSSADGKLYLRLYGYNDQTQLSELFSICTNIMLNSGESALSYTPYGTLDTFTIPEAVQALDGYGEGSSEDDYNYIEKTDDGRWLFHNGDNITDITDLMPIDNYIKVEGGGSIEAVNDYGYDVPSTIAYITKV